MSSNLAELFVPVPHLVAIASLPAEVTVDGVTVALTGEANGADVVGTLRAHVALARWRRGRREGAAHYEVVRTHPDRCAVTVVAEGLPADTVHALAHAVRRSIIAARQPVDAARRPRPVSPAGAAARPA